jgi:D-alanine-D-alanine ligase
VTHVVVLAGGLSPERDVSLRSGRRVAEALRGRDFDVTELDVDAGLLSTLAALTPDCVIPLLHGSAGEDGAIRNILQSLGISYVGSDGTACGLAFDKPIAKTILSGVGVQTPAFMALPQAIFRELGASAVLDAVVAEIPLPFVIKPTKGGSALGTMIVRDAGELPSAMMSAFAYGEIVMIEQLVTGVECAISVLELGDVEVLPPVEIVAPDAFYDYNARYVAGTTEFFVPARLSAEHLDAVRELGRTVHTTLGLRDWSRTDCIIDDAGTPWFLEVNVAPGMTETSLYPQSLVAAERDLGQTVASLITQAIARSLS